MKETDKVLKQVMSSVFKKPATVLYPAERVAMPERFRGKIIFHPESCIGCKICMKDCPSGAIVITKVGEKKFEAEINMAKCIYCAQCADSCPKKALESTQEYELAQIDKNKLKVVFHAQDNVPTEEKAP
jgi:formate hydrogenlyase subunit 6/NADH:ubiquinone oxidoreductase subunit I